MKINRSIVYSLDVIVRYQNYLARHDKRHDYIHHLFEIGTMFQHYSDADLYFVPYSLVNVIWVEVVELKLAQHTLLLLAEGVLVQLVF